MGKMKYPTSTEIFEASLHFDCQPFLAKNHLETMEAIAVIHTDLNLTPEVKAVLDWIIRKVGTDLNDI